MKKHTMIRSLILTAATSLGLALSASAQSSDVSTSTTTVPTDSGWGLIGSNYTSVNFRYKDLDSGPPSASRGVGVQFNQAVRDGFDFQLNYDWNRASTYNARFTDQDLNLGGTLYSRLAWGKPFVQALAGWEWARGGGASDNSFAYTLGAGVEFQVAQAIAITPYVNFVRATGFNRSEFDPGVKATYRINRQWGVTAGIEYDAIRHTKDATLYTAGVNYHF